MVDDIVKYFANRVVQTARNIFWQCKVFAKVTQQTGKSWVVALLSSICSRASHQHSYIARQVNVQGPCSCKPAVKFDWNEIMKMKWSHLMCSNVSKIPGLSIIHNHDTWRISTQSTKVSTSSKIVAACCTSLFVHKPWIVREPTPTTRVARFRQVILPSSVSGGCGTSSPFWRRLWQTVMPSDLITKHFAFLLLLNPLPAHVPSLPSLLDLVFAQGAFVTHAPSTIWTTFSHVPGRSTSAVYLQTMWFATFWRLCWFVKYLGFWWILKLKPKKKPGPEELHRSASVDMCKETFRTSPSNLWKSKNAPNCTCVISCPHRWSIELGRLVDICTGQACSSCIERTSIGLDISGKGWRRSLSPNRDHAEKAVRSRWRLRPNVHVQRLHSRSPTMLERKNMNMQVLHGSSDMESGST